MDKSITCFFTGNRDIPANELETLKQNTKSAIISLYNDGYRNFIAGGAVGFDTLAADTVLELRKTLDIKFYLVLPCGDQDKKFSPEQKSDYARIKEAADGVYILYDKYIRGCMHTRNRKMANNASACIAYSRKTTGGTAYTVDYAKKLGINIIYM